MPSPPQPKVGGEDFGGMTEAEFYRCECGHGPERHDFSQDRAEFLPTCTVKGCGCTGYDHITGKPNHPLAKKQSGQPKVEAARCAHERAVPPGRRRPAPDERWKCPDCGERVGFHNGELLTVREMNAFAGLAAKALPLAGASAQQRQEEAKRAVDAATPAIRKEERQRVREALFSELEAMGWSSGEEIPLDQIEAAFDRILERAALDTQEDTHA